jgi:hypothetical protein
MVVVVRAMARRRRPGVGRADASDEDADDDDAEREPAEPTLDH